MPGQKIKQRQIELYMKHRRNGKSQAVSAARAGFCERSARNIQKRDMKEANETRYWKTRKDPFKAVWDDELAPMLEEHPSLQARTLLEFLQQKYEGEFPDKLLRTLQRRVKEWKALYGPSKEVIFRQNHPPGWQGLSDFTPASSLEVTIKGELLEHNLYHYRLAFSGWEYADVVLGGESFTALAEHLQNALWECGGSPETHRTDSLSAAYKNLSKEDDLTEAYEEICRHYGIEPTRNNRGVSRENGTIETSHRHLKARLDQALMLRGSRDFDELADYRYFVREVVSRHNRRVQKEHLEELSYLRELPERRTTDYAEERARVTNSSTILVREVTYSVPSRLIGEILKVHLYDDRLDCFVGGTRVITLERKRRDKGRVRQINYRHVIGALAQKPGAFERYVYRDDLFPSLSFRQTWERLSELYGSRKACREYTAILKEAAEGEESRVEALLEERLLAGEVAHSLEVQELFRGAQPVPELSSSCGDLWSYDLLRRLS